MILRSVVIVVLISAFTVNVGTLTDPALPSTGVIALAEHTVWSNVADNYVRNGKYEEAIPFYDKALAVAPGNIDLLNKKGNAFRNLGRYEEAIAVYGEALEIDSGFKQAWYNKAIAYRDLGEYNKAIEYLNIRLEFNSEDTQVLYNIGRCYSLMGEKDKALIYLKTAVDLHGDELKEFVKGDDAFETYWDDPEFLEIVGE